MPASSHSSNPSPRLLFRADASRTIGSGHVMRCLSLARAWRQTGGEALFACAELPDSLRERLHREGCEVVDIEAVVGGDNDLQNTVRHAERISARAVVLDGYRFSAEYMSRLRGGTRRLLVVDDGADQTAYDCDWLLNQNLSATPAMYRGKTREAQLLLGSRYALLDEQFARLSTGESIASGTLPHARRVLITFGGADPPNATRKVLEALTSDVCSELEATVILGGGNPHRASLLQFVQDLPGDVARRIELVSDTREMSRHMARADVAVSAGGVTALELACLGVPMLLIVIADNQQAPAEAAAACGFAHLLGRLEQFDAASIAEALAQLCGDAKRRDAMRRRGRAAVDGRGAERVVRVMQRPCVHLRPATPDDCRQWWTWRNEPATRRVSFHSVEIPLPSHTAWYQKSLSDPRRRLFIVENDADQSIGFVRLDLLDGAAEISLGLAPEHRGRGYGEAVIRQAASQALTEGNVDVVVATVKEQNIASRRVFEQAGFRIVERLKIDRECAIRMQFPYSPEVKHEIRISKSETESKEGNSNAPNESHHAVSF